MTRPTIPQQLLDLMEKRLVDHKFRWFREGDPVLIPASQMPAMLVSEESTDWEAGPTGYDTVTHTLLLKVVLNKKSELGSKEQGMTLDKKVNQIMQARDENNQLLPGTVMGVLRQDFTLENTMINNIGTIRFGVVARPEETETVEAHLELVLTELVPVPNRA